jgi:hypothetical protein
MSKKVVALRALRAREARLGPGAHLGVIERRRGGALDVRMADGSTVAARLDPRVEPALMDECQRDERWVVLVDGASGPTVVGALQVERSAVRERDGSLSLDGKDVVVRASRRLRVEAGASSLTLDAASGAVRLEGERMVIDMGALVRLLAARVELP